ncbi:MAG: DHH family phosphoesterase, partial [Candidatus Woesearchaeota archaeon]
MNAQIPPAQPQIDAINALMEKAADALKSQDPQKPITLVYHDDTDGLSSGAIMAETLRRMDRKTEQYCMEQIYPVPIMKIYEKARGPIVIMDLGVSSKYRSFICQQTKDRPTIILDHHGSFEKDLCPDDGKIFNINCNKYQISGDCYSSASTLVYMFAQKLGINITDLAQLAVLGAFGDRNHMHGEDQESFSKYGLDYKVFEQAKNVTVSDVHVYRVKL